MNPLPGRRIIAVVFLSLIPLLAMAQPGDKSLDWSGYTHTALGAAVLSVSPDDHLVVGNIGSSGLDGVTGDLGAESWSCVIWDFEGGLTPPPGAAYRYDLLGDLDGLLGQTCMSLLYTYVAGTVQLTADATPMGSTTHRVQVFAGEAQVADLIGQSGVLATAADTSGAGNMDAAVPFNFKVNDGVYCEAKIESATGFTLGDGSNVIGDRIRITPEAPTLTPLAINGYALTAQDTPPLVITEVLSGVVIPPNSVYWSGLAHAPQGAATLTVSADDHLIVSNIGSSGLDGVSIDVGETAGGFLTQLPVGPAMPLGSWMRSDFYGDVNGVPDQPAGSLGMEWVPGGIAALVDFSAVGSPTYTLELRDAAGNVVVVQPNLSSGDVHIIPDDLDDVTCKCDWDWLDSRWTWSWPIQSTTVNFGTGVDYSASEIIFRPDSPLLGPVQVRQVDMLASDMPSFEVIGEKILVYEQYFQAEGDAHLDASSGQLTISNIGSSGLDGVSIDFPAGTQEECVFMDVASGGSGEVAYEMFGTVDGAVGSIGTTTYTEIPGGNVQVTADYSPIGSPTQLVQIWNGPTLVAEFAGQSGVLAELEVFGNRYEGYVKYEPGSVQFAVEAKVFSVQPITGPLGDVFLGDRITVIPEGAVSAVDDLQGAVVLCSGVDSLVVSNVILTVSAVGIDDTALPKAMSLRQNIPNPFNPNTTIFFEMPRRGQAILKVYDVRGSLVRTLESGAVEAGRHERIWLGRDDNGRQVSSGVYFYRLETTLGEETKRMTLVK